MPLLGALASSSSSVGTSLACDVGGRDLDGGSCSWEQCRKGAAERRHQRPASIVSRSEGYTTVWEQPNVDNRCCGGCSRGASDAEGCFSGTCEYLWCSQCQVLAVFSHFYLHEVMHGLDWVGVILASLGTVVIGALAEQQKDAKISLGRSLLFLFWLALFFGIIDCWARSGKKRHEKHDEGDVQLRDVDVMEELAAGLEAGACFGMSASVCKVGFMLAERGFSQWFVPAGIAIGICCSSSGFFCQTRGLKNGRAVVVSTCAAVASILTGVLVGLFALGESLPASTSGRLSLLLAWTLIVSGIIVLLLSEKIALMLPRSLRRVLKPKAPPQKPYIRTSAGSSSRRDVGTSGPLHVKVSSS